MSGTYAPGEPADAALVEAARRGDLYAWERLVRRYQEAIYRVGWLVVRDSDLAQAATLSTFVRAYRALPAYEGALGLMPWLIRIAAGESRQQRRESGRPTRSDRPAERQEAPHFPASPVPGLAGTAEMTPLERQTIAEGFDRLGEEDRLVIAVRYLFRLDRDAAAGALSIASNLVDEHLESAHKRLRTRLTVGVASVERHPGSISGLADDQLATIAVSLVVSELEWSPDVAPATLDRISRDAVAYPEQFDRRTRAPGPKSPPPPTERSAKRAVGRLAVFGVILVIIIGVVAFAATASASAAVPEGLRVRLDETVAGFDRPLLVTNAGDGSGTTYVVEQPGRVWAVDPAGERAAQPFLDLSEQVSLAYEQGLLGLAFHPAFADNGRLFVNYTRAEDGATVVSELSAADGVVDSGSERVLLTIDQPYGNHNGGHLAFDAAGMLLIGTGDGGSGGDPLGAGQDPTTLLGKLLRIDVDAAEPYGIPADNGFAGRDQARPEIHALGLRNPWRFSVDPVGGHIYLGDVGQGSYEEISVAPEGRGGQSFGWSEVEGPACYVSGCDLAAHTPPAISYGHEDGCTVIGGHAYRGTDQPELEGVYIFGDYCSGRIWGADADELVAGSAASVPIGAIDGTLVSFGVDERGELYAVDQGGRILHVVTEAS